MLLVDTELFMKGESPDYAYTVGVGNYRLGYARRFNLSPNARQLLAPIPEIIGK